MITNPSILTFLIHLILPRYSYPTHNLFRLWSLTRCCGTMYMADGLCAPGYYSALFLSCVATTTQCNSATEIDQTLAHYWAVNSLEMVLCCMTIMMHLGHSNFAPGIFKGIQCEKIADSGQQPESELDWQTPSKRTLYSCCACFEGGKETLFPAPKSFCKNLIYLGKQRETSSYDFQFYIYLFDVLSIN